MALWLIVVLAVLGGIAALALGLLVFVVFTHWQWVTFNARTGTRVALGAWPTLALWSGELRALGTLIWWSMTGFGDGGFSPGQTKHRGRPVVCVHGILGNASNLRGIRRALEAAGRPAYAVNLGRPWRAIEAYASPLALALHQAAALHPEGDGIDVVCHSMGGLVLRCVLAADPELAALVRTIVCIGTPHEGAEVAAGFTFVPEGAALARGSSWLRSTAPLTTSAPHARIVNVVAKGDTIVYPIESCAVHGSEVRRLDRLMGHAQTLTSDEAIRAVVAALAVDAAVPAQ